MHDEYGVKPWVKTGVTVFALVVLVIVILLLSMRSVNEGETCVVTTFGKATGEANAGINFRWPLVQKFNCFSSRLLVYETSDDPNAGSKADYRDYTVEGQTSDGQQISINYSVTFYVPPKNAMRIYRDTARDNNDLVERVIKVQSRSVSRLTAQQYEAQTLYSGNITEYQENVRHQLEELFTGYGIVLDDFALRKVSFQPEYSEAIEQQQIAREGIETAKYQSEQEKYRAEQAVVKAEGDARAAVETAKGDALSQIERARGEAEAITLLAKAESMATELRGKAIEDWPLVLKLNFIEALKNAKWMMLPSDSVTPFLQIDPEETTQP